MRIGVIADIHGNLVALEAVLAALEAAAPDRVICLGDVAVLGPQPAGVLSRLQGLNCPIVLGNTDVWLLEGGPTAAPTAEIVAWTREQVGSGGTEFVRGFQPTVELDLGSSGRLLACHGSPRSFSDVISATTPAEELTSMVGGADHQIVVGGHTHVQLVRRLDQRYFVNPGSVGLPGVGPGTPDLPVNRDVRWAEYAILDLRDEGHSIDLRRVPLNLADVVAAARASGMPAVDWWISLWAAN